MGKINTVKMVNLPKSIYRFDTIPTKNCNFTLHINVLETKKKIIWKNKRHRMTKATNNNNTVSPVGFNLPNPATL